MIYHAQTVFTRTTKGVREARSTKLPRELSRIFAAVDGKATVAELISKSGVPEGHCHLALEQLVIAMKVKVLEPRAADFLPHDGSQNDVCESARLDTVERTTNRSLAHTLK